MTSHKRHALIGGLLCALAVASPWTASAQSLDQVSCDEMLLPRRTSRGKPVGPQACKMQELDVTIDGRTYRRVDVGLDGTVEGYLPKTGQYINYFASAPELVFPAGRNPGPIYHGVATYTAATGAAMTVLYPRDRPWNGKMWVMVHGRGRSFKRGSLRAWDRNLDRAEPDRDIDRYDRLILAKGFALVRTHRTSDTVGGDVQVTLDEGTFYPEKNLNDNAQYIVDVTRLAKRAIEKRLGQPPTRTYFYGHSAGGRIGRSLNYVPGLNIGPDGKPVFDGILADDSATGLWLPVVMQDGQDVLFATDADRKAFVPQLEVTHQMYNAESPGIKAPWISTNYLQNKRQNAKLLRDKGLSPKHRMYEVRRISHSGGEMLPGGRRDPQILDLALLMDTFIDMLDAWVEKGVPPPASRSDWPELGDVDRDGIVDLPALAFPEVACPLGVFHQYPPARGTTGGGSTAFAPFTGDELEPLDGRGVFVDMNGNGVWDARESPTAAWQRLGLLPKGQSLTHEIYTACVQNAAGHLRKDGFFTDRTAQWYVSQARTADLAPKSVTPSP